MGEATQAKEASGEKAPVLANAPAEYLVVSQPPRIQSLLLVLSDLEKIAERVGEGRSGDPGSAGGSSGASGAGTSTQISPRDQAIQALPSTDIMRQRLSRHLEHEIHILERRAKHEVRKLQWNRGSATLLNEAYARIRKIRSLIAELFEATADLVRRLYIRLFIDHQQLV